MRKTLLFASLLALTSCNTPISESAPDCPIFGGVDADHLIQPGEDHFVHLWMLSDGGENAEAYWSFDGDRLSFQARDTDEGVNCDRIYVTSAAKNTQRVQVSNGQGDDHLFVLPA